MQNLPASDLAEIWLMYARVPRSIQVPMTMQYNGDTDMMMETAARQGKSSTDSGERSLSVWAL